MPRAARAVRRRGLAAGRARDLALVLGLALGAAGSAGCSRGPQPPRLVVLYATCTLARDHLSPWNDEVRFTPALAELAREGVVFERHTTEAGQSGPAYAALFSATHADRHGVFHHPSPLAEEPLLAAEAFAAAGYETFFWNGHQMASIELGYGRGVPPENAFVRRPPDKGMLSGTDPRFQQILARLASDPDYKAFVQLNFTLTHGPYQRYSPERMTGRFCERFPERARGLTPADFARFLPIYNRNRHELQFDFPATRERLGLSDQDVDRLARVLDAVYSSCVHNLDSYLGAFVATIRDAGLKDQSLVAFTADHGEALYREDRLFHWCHGGQLVPEVLDVPLVLWGAGLAPGRYRGVTRSVDVFPTLAGLCSVPLSASAELEGVDLTPALRGAAPEPDLVALSHTTTVVPEELAQALEWGLFASFNPRTDPTLMWVRARRGDLAYELRDQGAGAWGMSVFDLALDPAGTQDRFDPASAEQAAMRRLLDDYRARLIAGFERHYEPREGLDPEVEAELRALGYIR